MTFMFGGLESRRRTVLKGAMIAVATIGIPLFGRWANAESDIALRSRILETIGTWRPFQFRLSGQTRYAACHPVEAEGALCQAAREPPPDALRRLSKVAVLIRRSFEDTVQRDAPHASAVMDLTLSPLDVRSLDRAAARLTELAAAAGTPEVLNDLAIVYFMRAERTGDRLDLLRSLDVIERAALDSSASAEVRFNRSLIVEKNLLLHQAAHSWKAYLTEDLRSAWSLEAEAHAAALTALRSGPWSRARMATAIDSARTETAMLAAVDEDRQNAREFALERLLERWALALLAGDNAAAAANHHKLATVARALRESNGDRSVVDAVAAIEAATGNPARLEAVARGMAAWARGRVAYRRALVDVAGPALDSAAALLSAAGNTFAWQPRVYGAGVAVTRGRFADARPTLDSALRVLDPATQPSLTGVAEWLMGLGLARNGDLPGGLQHYRAALTAFQRAGERENRGAVQFLIAEVTAALGDEHEGLEIAYGALADMSVYPNAPLLHALLITFGRIARGYGMLHAAARFELEAVQVGGLTGRLHMPVEAWSYLAHTRIQLGQFDDARDALHRAREMLTQVTDTLTVRRMRAELNEVEGELLLRDAPARAVPSFDAAVDYFTDRAISSRVILARSRRGAAQRLAHDFAAARTDLDIAVSESEAQADRLSNDGRRAEHLQTVLPAFDEMVLLQLDYGRTVDGLAYLERSRGEFGARGASREISALAHGLSPRTAVVEYALIGERAMVWVITADSITVRTLPTTRSQLMRQIARLQNLIQNNVHSPTLDSVSNDLFTRLVLPVERLLAPRSELVIVPDGILNRLPFAALRTTGGKFLVERWSLRMAPSASYALAPPTSAQPQTAGRALLVGAADVDYKRWPELAPLKHDSLELADVLRFYPRHALLSGPSATITRVRASLAGSDLLHYAGHALFHPARADNSYLLLTPDRDDGLLRASDVVRLDLRHLRLVVLSACSTNSTVDSRLGGFSRLAGAFLIAGVGGVVGSLWDVDDDATRVLLTEFHRHFARGEPAADALRSAQRALLHSKEPRLARPSAWAAFRYEGR